jgi:uncharacterized phiE125 gp8 family phage protein
MQNLVARAEEVTPPATEPVTIHEAKSQVNLAASDTSHDSELVIAVRGARQQWERDTQEFFISRSMRLTLDGFEEFKFPHRPVTAISSVTYYDLDNAQQTLSSSAYQLDAPHNRIRLAYNQEWPNAIDRWDAVAINYTLGTYSDSTQVPAIAKQAMLLLVGYYFDANRGDFDRPNDQKAYERLVHKYMRSTYP